MKALQELIHILDYVMPGIKKMFNSCNEANGKAKLSDFVERFWHFALITSMSFERFIDEYLVWAEEKKYHRSRSKDEAVYELASSGIPTLSSSIPSTKMLVQEAVSVLRTVDSSLFLILTRMQDLEKSLPEYPTVRKRGGFADVLAVKLIAEIGDVRKLHSAKVLVAWAGIAPPPYESGQSIGTKRKITKRESSTVRKVGYKVMRVLKSHPAPKDDAVYNYILKEEREGKIRNMQGLLI